jgi:hypothetical protein
MDCAGKPVRCVSRIKLNQTVSEEQNMALGKMQQAAIKAMSRAQVDAMGDSPKELEVKEYWYSVHANEVTLADTPNTALLERLDGFVAVPRSADTQFIQDVAGKLPLFGKDKVLNKLAAAPLLYGAVVQAHHALFKSGNYQNLGSVIVISLAQSHMRDVSYLSDISARIAELKSAPAVPEDMKKLIADLRKDTGYFCHKVASSVSPDNETWCATFTIESQAILPMNRITDEKIIPFLLKETPQENQFIQLAIIPGKYYSA